MCVSSTFCTVLMAIYDMFSIRVQSKTKNLSTNPGWYSGKLVAFHYRTRNFFVCLLVINMFNNSLILIVLFWFNFGSCKHQYRFSVSERLSCNQGKPSDPIPSSLLSPLHNHNQQRQHTPSQYPPTSCRSLLPFPHSSPFPSLSPFTPLISVPIQITALNLTPFPAHFNPTPYSHPNPQLIHTPLLPFPLVYVYIVPIPLNICAPRI